MNTIQLRSLSFTNKAKLTLGLVWRGIVVGLASMIVSFPIGFIAGMTAEFIGLNPLVLSVPAGFAVGLLAYYWFIKWFTSTKIGNYKLVLVEEK